MDYKMLVFNTMDINAITQNMSCRGVAACDGYPIDCMLLRENPRNMNVVFGGCTFNK